MHKKSIRIGFVVLAAFWMFLLGAVFIYSKKLNVKTSAQELNFQVVEKQTSSLPSGIRIVKPGATGVSYNSTEYISLAGKSLDVKSYSNIFSPDDEIIYIGNGEDEVLKSKLVDEFNSKINDIAKVDEESASGIKNPIVTFSGKAEETKDTNLILVGNLEFLMSNCNFYASTSILIDKADLVLTVGEITPEQLCKKYSPPSTPKQINCGDNCDLAPIDKNNSLSSSYVPNVRAVDFMNPGFEIKDTVYPFLRDMYVAAQNDGINFKLTSTYRSYNTQKGTFDGWVEYEMSFGKSYEAAVAAASTYSALPGHSEHQLGTTADMNSGDCAPFVAACDDNERVWKWLANNAHKFGFVMSYQPYKEHLTGYVYEPWHYRWIGVELATLYKEKYENISYSTEFLRNIAK